MYVKLQNDLTHDVKVLKVGFDWLAFFSVFLFGIPHLIRGLYTVGALLLGWSLAGMFMPMEDMTAEEAGVVVLLSLVVSVGVGIYLGKTGRAQHVKRLLAKGYRFSEPDGEITQTAKTLWGIA